MISVMCVTLRGPPCRRLAWMIMSTALAICCRMAFSGSSKPAIVIMVSIRATASRGVLAWIVVIEPSWPVFMACSMSSVSGPRHSPMMIRSGRIRRALRTRSVAVMAPLPSMLGGRVSSRTTCSCCKLQFGRVLDRHDAVRVGDEAGKRVQQRRLAGTRTAGDDDVQPGLDRPFQQHHHLRREGLVVQQVFQFQRIGAESPNRNRAPRPGPAAE